MGMLLLSLVVTSLTWYKRVRYVASRFVAYYLISSSILTGCHSTVGFYNDMDIQRSDGFVVQTGDPKGEAEGYVGTPTKSVGAGKHGERLIPLEIFPKGDKGPFYETTIEDEGRGGEATVLPFSSYGAMGWAREEYDPNSGSSQFFWLLFDSDLTPAGKNVLDGRYPVFGYVVEGADFLRDIKEGDIIASAKVTEGKENLVQPK